MPLKTLNRAQQVARQLKRDYPDVSCALHYAHPLELLIATILSAQCTDERVNQVTATLFQKYRSAADFARARPSTLENDIRSTGFFRNKAKNIIACCNALVEEYDGKVPADLDALVRLPGVGRKTANVVLGTAFGISSGVVVDTHVTRLSWRLGLTSHRDAEKIEMDLMQALPKKEWIHFSHRMIHHGRRVCQARTPRCHECHLQTICPRIDVAD